MVKISLVMCVLAIFAFAQVVNSKTPAPAPAVDCATIIFSMADCLTFVTNGSKVTKPEGACCSGLKTVLKTDAECICEVFKNSGSLGIVLDIKKAMTLPAACGVSAPSIDKCGLDLALSPGGGALSPGGGALSPGGGALSPGGGAPAQSPGSTVVPPITSGTLSPAPAPSPPQDTTPGSSQVAAPAPDPSVAAPAPDPSVAASAPSVVAPAPSAASTSTISSLALLVSLVAASYSFL